MDKKFIYADNAATTKMDESVFDAMKKFMMDDFYNPSQIYSCAKIVNHALQQARREIADCINAEPDEIYFTSCGSESDNWMIKSFANDSENNVIITSTIEHHAILNSCKSIKNKVYYVSVNEFGEVDLKELESILSKISSQKLVSIMFANNEIGTINDVRKISDLVHKYKAIFHTDAVQAVGHVEIDVKDMGIDALSSSAHKFNGPKGIGFLYIKKGLNLKPFIDGGKQENFKRAGTENVASIVGMAKALRLNINSMEKTQKKLKELTEIILKGLKENNVDFIRNGSENRLPGNLSLSFRGKNGESLVHLMDLKGICVSTGSACNTKVTELSHVIEAIKVPDEYKYGTIRISLGKNNTNEEAYYITKTLLEILKY